MKTSSIKLSHYKVPTKEAENLKMALEKRGIKVYIELYDGYKHIDLTIPKAKIDIEVDGIQHFTDPKQILSDLSRGYYSYQDGYDTIHISNEIVRSHLEEVADALAKAAQIREKRINVIIH